MTSVEIPRPYFLTSISNRQLHIFCDSSQLAYGAVAYLRGMSGAEIYTAFTMAKTRVAPIKTQTLPRLELLAALLGAQLSEYLTKTLQLTKTKCEFIYWSEGHPLRDRSQVTMFVASDHTSSQAFLTGNFIYSATAAN